MTPAVYHPAAGQTKSALMRIISKALFPENRVYDGPKEGMLSQLCCRAVVATSLCNILYEPVPQCTIRGHRLSFWLRALQTLASVMEDGRDRQLLQLLPDCSRGCAAYSSQTVC